MTTTQGEKRSAPLKTETESSSGVRVFWLDRTEVLRRLREAVRTLTLSHPEIKEGVLFGSLARGEAVPGSDADVLLVLSDSDLPFIERSVLYRLGDVGVDVDVLAYTRRELDEMLDPGGVCGRGA